MRTTNLVVKVASRCNLNCTYCYMYNMGDDSYKLQPKFMTKKIIEAMFTKIKTHCFENKIERFLIVFHGGEPLLNGIDFYTNFIEIGNKIIPNSIIMDYAMQSNGVLLTEEIAKELKQLNIQIGISIDGTPKSNNKNRVYHNGEGSYDKIVDGFNLVKNIYGKEYANCLCVIDTNEKPSEVYSHFKSIGANSVHLLFQDFNYLQSKIEDVPKIGDWLIEVFKLWYSDKDENKPSIRPFTDLIGLILGVEKYSEIFGKGVNDTLVIETDGSIETVDTLKICGNGFTKTNFNVLDSELSTIYKNSELARLYYYAHDNLCKKCSDCPIEPVCGGGYLGHRFSNENYFDNPSIYCVEIVKLICYIQNETLKNMQMYSVNESKIDFLNFDEIINMINYETSI
jgi:uncharacterized protein